MLAQVLLTSSLIAMPAAERHAQVWAELTAADRAAASVTRLAQAMPPPPEPGRPLPPGPDGFGGMPPGPPWLRGLALTESQQDKVFAIAHGQMPALRERFRELRRAHEELRTVARAERFDEARATALADSIAKATAAIELTRARSDAAIWQVLTPEQRRQVGEMPPRAPHDGPHPERGAPRPPR